LSEESEEHGNSIEDIAIKCQKKDKTIEEKKQDIRAEEIRNIIKENKDVDPKASQF